MDRESLRELRQVGELPVLVVLGFGLYFLAIWATVVRAEWMPEGLRRILEVERHLASGAGPTGGVAAFGSSVLVEGLDCAVLARALAEGTRCDNLAWTGGNVRQWLLVTPALHASPPRVVLLGLDLFTLLSPAEVPVERIAIAGFWRFVPDAELPAYREILAPGEVAVLESSRALQLLRFRGFPLNAWNERVREVARSDLRYEGYATNFVAPWVRRQAAPATALHVHLEQVRSLIRDGGTYQLPETTRQVEQLVERIRAGGPSTRFLLVLTPVHPELVATLPPGALDEVRSSVRSLAARIGVDAQDDTLALGAAGFSDAVHPFAEGRTQWSLALGRAAAGLLGR